MKVRLTALMIAVLMLGGCLLTGCGEQAGESGSGEEKVFTVASNLNLTTMAPWQSTTDGDYYIFYQIYSRLVETDYKGNYYPDLAESWESTEDGMTWTFHLTENFYWQRGNDLFGDELVEVTADDVKYSLEYVMNPDNACTRLQDLTSTIESITVVDDKTIQIKTFDVDGLFLYKMSTIMIIPQKAAEEGWDLTEQPVGSGPFKWESNIVDTEVVLVKNEDYFIEPNLDKVVFKFITESSVAAIALANEEVDHITSFAYTEIETIQGNENLEVQTNGSMCNWIAINVTRSLFEDVRVRRAIASFIDMDALVAAVYPDDGTGVVQAIRAYGQIPPDLPGSDQERMKAVTPPYDPEAGHALMEEAGWTRNANGIYEKDGQEFAFELQVGTNNPVRVNCAVVLSGMWNEQGLSCTSKSVEWGTHLADASAGNCDMYIVGGYAGVDGAMQVMHTDSTGSFSPNPGYSNAEVDALLEEAWRTVDDAAREELITEAQEIWLYDTVYLPMYFSYSFTATNNRVTNFYVNDEYTGVDDVEFNLTSRMRNVDIAE